MNQSDVYKMMDEFLAGPFAFPTRLVFWSNAHPTAAWIIVISYSVVWLISILHCLHSQAGIDRTTWLILLLFLPVFGILFYWTLSTGLERVDVIHSAPTPPAPPSTRSIADSVNAAIAEDLKKRRQR